MSLQNQNRTNKTDLFNLHGNEEDTSVGNIRIFPHQHPCIFIWNCRKFSRHIYTWKIEEKGITNIFTLNRNISRRASHGFQQRFSVVQSWYRTIRILVSNADYRTSFEFAFDHMSTLHCK